MKKRLAALLALLMLLSLCACTAGGGSGAAPEEPAASQSEAPLQILDPVEQTPTETEAPAAGDTGETTHSSSTAADDAGITVTDSDTETGYSYTPDTEYTSDTASTDLEEGGVYTAAADVALYIHTYNHLPDNFITKQEARDLGWTGGSLEPYAPGMCIGGDYFGNYEGLLPKQKGRTYTECDINTLGARSRGAERIIFSNDGLIYYTDDHYESFTLLYGEE